MTSEPPSLNAATASLLRDAFSARSRPVAAVASLAGLPRRYVWERLTTGAEMDVDDLDRIAGALGLDPADLIARAALLTEPAEAQSDTP